MKKKIPVFRAEEQEREFWSHTDSASYLDWTKARKLLFPNLKPTLRTISFAPSGIHDRPLKVLANKRDVPYQSLMKIFLAERLAEEK